MYNIYVFSDLSKEVPDGEGSSFSCSFAQTHCQAHYSYGREREMCG